MKPIASAIIIDPRTTDTATGTLLGEPGSQMPENSPAVEWLVKRAPRDVDEAAVLRASQLGVGLKVSYDYRFPRDERGNSLPMVTIVKGCAVRGDYGDRVAVVDKLRTLCSPAPARYLEGWLAELSVIVPRRVDDEFTEGLRLGAYAARLGQYPADVAREAVLGRTWRFWPSWAELQRICDELYAPRKAMIAALSAPPPPPPPEPVREEEAGSKLSRAEFAAKVMREVYGRDR